MKIGRCEVHYSQVGCMYEIFIGSTKVASCHNECGMKNICEIINNSIDVWNRLQNSTIK